VTRRILIVDDDEHTRTLLRDFCEQSNFVASVAPDGEQIVAKLDQFRPDLVLLDLVMPNKDGFAVLKEIRTEPSSPRRKRRWPSCARWTR